jgi:non-ribosomal peptide synthase protein (TIGR01720 family)
VSASLGQEETRALLQDVPQAYQTHINDVLLTALVQTLTRWTGARAHLVDLEGHGREEIVEGMDLSRTVGWFTTLFPVLLQLEPAAKPGEALKAVKEQVRSVPNRGIGYGVLRYLCQDVAVTAQLRDLPQAEVCFNYLGQFDQVLPKSGLFGLVQRASRFQRNLRGSRRYLLEVNGRIAQGELHLEWTYSAHVHHHATVAGLAQGCTEALRTLILHCRSPKAGGYTPSDFPQMRLNQRELDELLTALDEFAEGN